jgi:CRISPR-associated protein Csd1
VIIHALYDYYGRLLEDENSKISRPGYSKAKVSYALVLSKEGNLVDIIDLRVEKEKKLVSIKIEVPEQVKRSSGIAANFMCDNGTYVLGLSLKGKKDRSKEAYAAFAHLHEEILANVEDEGVVALIDFLRNWNLERAELHPKVVEYKEGLLEGGNFVFRLEGEQGYIHERLPVIKAWDKHKAEQQSEVIGQCLITGEQSPIARLHQNIKGVVGAQSTGASLVSFNLDSFTSYGKTQSYNAPVSEQAAFGYTTALNYLLNTGKHRLRIGDTTTVFWAERSTNGGEEDLLRALFYPPQANDNREGEEQKQVTDPKTVQCFKDIVGKIRSGVPIHEGLKSIDPNNIFYILGLAPNAGRLSVRFWHVDSFGSFLDKVGQHYKDLSMVKSYSNEPDFISIGSILREVAPLSDAKRIPPLLGGTLMRSILTGLPYPQILYNAMISKIRADQVVNYIRASLIKAFLTRNYRYFTKRNVVAFSMVLDEQNTKISYRLGRLFALLEKAQKDANPGLNATLRDRYFCAASATPGAVFPKLLRLAQHHHLVKAEYGLFTVKRIEEVISGFQQFPTNLSLEDQGLFVLGYYHQRQALFTKNEGKEG